MRDGDEIRIIGSGGAPALITVGRPFELPEIKAKLATGEWRLAMARSEKQSGAAVSPGTEDTAAQADEQLPADDRPEAPEAGGKPPQSASKADWIEHIVRSRLMSREDAANYTKQDLIDMVS